MEETNFTNQNPQVGQNFNPQNGQIPVPNSTAVLVLGICSIFPGRFCLGIVGIICGIIALVFANKAMVAYNNNPSNFSMASFNNLKAGKVCAIVGVCLSSLLLIFYVLYFMLIGAAFSIIPWQNMH